ncbi:hypothetical protein E4U43_005209 [Claviceps pusilla]|uniref:Uncharacterized protein n=1 Tax=Claviceps pusilla TaxID=123648 RepID=A0A9P7N551_9HYPO|nr:hypothetical protein E4U43_005209 [Claviceps pusilla]
METQGELTKNCQKNVNDEMRSAACLKKDTQRGQNDGQDNLADVAAGTLRALRLDHRNIGRGSVPLTSMEKAPQVSERSVFVSKL